MEEEHQHNISLSTDNNINIERLVVSPLSRRTSVASLRFAPRRRSSVVADWENHRKQDEKWVCNRGRREGNGAEEREKTRSTSLKWDREQEATMRIKRRRQREREKRRKYFYCNVLIWKGFFFFVYKKKINVTESFLKINISLLQIIHPFDTNYSFNFSWQVFFTVAHQKNWLNAWK